MLILFIPTLQFSLPSFSLKFPSFKLGSKWKKTLYGNLRVPPVELPSPQPSIQVHPSLNDLQLSLQWNGEASFELPGWKLSASLPSFELTSPKLLHANGLQLLRGEDGEIGFSFDKNSTRHFFVLGKPSSPKFSLKFKVH